MKSYIIPEEIINNTLEELERIILHSKDKNKEYILNLYVYCIKESDKMPIDFYKSEQWSNIMTAVHNYLMYYEKFDLSEWEIKENL